MTFIARWKALLPLRWRTTNHRGQLPATDRHVVLTL